MSKSDSLKNGMRSGLDGLLSSTGKRKNLHRSKRKKSLLCIAILLSTKASIPG